MSLSENIRSARDCRQGRARERGKRTETARRRGVFRFLCTRARQRASERTIGCRIPSMFHLSFFLARGVSYGRESSSPPRKKKKDGRREKSERKKGREGKSEGDRAGAQPAFGPILLEECPTYPSSGAARVTSCGTAVVSSSRADHAFIVHGAGRRGGRARRAFHLENRGKRRATFLPRYTGRPTLRRRAVRRDRKSVV